MSRAAMKSPVTTAAVTLRQSPQRFQIVRARLRFFLEAGLFDKGVLRGAGIGRRQGRRGGVPTPHGPKVFGTTPVEIMVFAGKGHWNGGSPGGSPRCGISTTRESSKRPATRIS